jgi:hypothetical protein
LTFLLCAFRLRWPDFPVDLFSSALNISDRSVVLTSNQTAQLVWLLFDCGGLKPAFLSFPAVH